MIYPINENVCGVYMKNIFQSRILAFSLVILTSMTAAAGLHAYTNNIRVNHMILDLVYWSEIGSSYAGIILG